MESARIRVAGSTAPHPPPLPMVRSDYTKGRSPESPSPRGLRARGVTGIPICSTHLLRQPWTSRSYRTRRTHNLAQSPLAAAPSAISHLHGPRFFQYSTATGAVSSYSKIEHPAPLPESIRTSPDNAQQTVATTNSASPESPPPVKRAFRLLCERLGPLPGQSSSPLQQRLPPALTVLSACPMSLGDCPNSIPDVGKTALDGMFHKARHLV